MVKKLMFASALTVSTTAMVLMAPAASRFAMAGDAAYPVAEDSVFMDEGDGEFAAPVAADVQKPEKKAASTKKSGKKTASNKSASPRKPASTEDDQTTPAAPGNLDDLDVNAMTEAAKAQGDQAAAPAPAPAAEAAPAPAPQEASAPAEAPAPVADTAAPAADAPAAATEAPAKPKVKNHGSVKHAAVEKVAPVAKNGMFASTKQACPMLREPASESEKMITVKADRKIWVEEVDGSWVRAFNKAGEPGYVNKDCFQ